VIAANTISENRTFQCVFKIETMKTLGSRIAHYRKAAGLSQERLARACGWASQSRVGNYELGTREPSLDDIALMAKALGVAPDLLLLHTATDESAREHGPDENGSPSKKEYALIPQYTARASAGSGYHNDHVELTEGQGLVFKRDWLKRLSLKEESSCVIYAEGSSMEPTISDGDVLLIDRASTEPRSGKVYAIQRPDGSVSVKRLVQTFAGGWVVRSDNPDKTLYADEQISADDLQHVEIIGRSVWGGGGM
jgi:phage repressor protein C with HTH and peptisase S24 domain